MFLVRCCGQHLSPLCVYVFVLFSINVAVKKVVLNSLCQCLCVGFSVAFWDTFACLFSKTHLCTISATDGDDWMQVPGQVIPG